MRKKQSVKAKAGAAWQLVWLQPLFCTDNQTYSVPALVTRAFLQRTNTNSTTETSRPFESAEKNVVDVPIYTIIFELLPTCVNTTLSRTYIPTGRMYKFAQDKKREQPMAYQSQGVAVIFTPVVLWGRR
uniref:Uncharacterized protein n=1 Tax=Opuntia streptacantha TaxID=393608 RepID=A0A7C9AHR8_OPUST